MLKHYFGLIEKLRRGEYLRLKNVVGTKLVPMHRVWKRGHKANERCRLCSRQVHRVFEP